MEKLKILVSAYACGPNRGSEPGMGWNFVSGLSRYHEVHVITEKRKWAAPISAFLKENPVLSQNLKFYFIDKKRNKQLRKIWPPSYYWFYKKWQKKAYDLALKLEIKEDFDIVHQLNMVGFREPGYLWKIDKPFVWGPVGGLKNSPWRFLPSLGFKGMVYYAGRNTFNCFQRKFKLRARMAANRKNSSIIAATPGTADTIKKLWHTNSTVICEVGQENRILTQSNKRANVDSLIIMWSGTHTAGKNLPLLLYALTRAEFPYVLHILGRGEMTKKWQKIAKTLRINDHCHWHGWLERNSAIEVMKTGHVLCITSVSDLTSTVTLEGLSLGLPIVCLDHCGFAHVVTERCGIKIPVVSPKNAAQNFNMALTKLFNNEELRQELSNGAIERALDFRWDKKIENLNEIYSELLKHKN